MYSQPENGEFGAQTPCGYADAQYLDKKDNVRNFYHTFVPTGCRKHGYGTALIKEALRMSREQGKTIHATCPFVRAYMRKEKQL